MGMPEIGEIIGHNGMWIGFVYYWSTHNLTIIGTLNQANPMDGLYGSSVYDNGGEFGA